MISKLKTFLDNSYVWLIALLGAVFFFWRKEQDLETKLAETKADATIQQDKDKITQADYSAAAADLTYEQLRSQYLDATKRDPKTGP